MCYADLFVLCVLGLLPMVAAAQDKKPDFSGKWQFDSAKSAVKSGKLSSLDLSIEQKGTSINIVKTTKSGGKDSSTQFTCTTDGKDCDAKGTKVSLWFDGPSLIEMDVSNEMVVKYKMTLANDGKSLDVAVTYISPQAEPDEITLGKS